MHTHNIILFINQKQKKNIILFGVNDNERKIALQKCID